MEFIFHGVLVGENLSEAMGFPSLKDLLYFANQKENTGPEVSFGKSRLQEVF